MKKEILKQDIDILFGHISDLNKRLINLKARFEFKMELDEKLRDAERIPILEKEPIREKPNVIYYCNTDKMGLTNVVMSKNNFNQLMDYVNCLERENKNITEDYLTSFNEQKTNY